MTRRDPLVRFVLAISRLRGERFVEEALENARRSLGGSYAAARVDWAERIADDLRRLR